MGNIVDTTKPTSETRLMSGRRIIYTDVDEITSENVVAVLQKAISTHELNRSEIDYLWRYYKGEQPIRNRVKEVRPEICNKIVENRANEIVSFKVGYICGEPIQYVGRTTDENVTADVIALNEYMFLEDKAGKDQSLFEWQMIGGTSYRIVLPNKNYEPESDSSPFTIRTLDPRDTFVVYAYGLAEDPLLAVKYYTDDNNINHYYAYTKDTMYTVEGDNLVKSEPHALGSIPIVEYPANNARLGSFEIVLHLLDAINNVSSNRMDAIEQTVQAFIKFVNCDITAEDFQALKDMGAIKVKSVDGAPADVDSVNTDLNQDQTQTQKDDLYNAVLTICGIPNRNGGSSTSDTGKAVLLRDGWSLAEARAKDSENMFKPCERQMLKIVFKICNSMADMNLRQKDIEIQFTRRNYDNIQSKAQVLVQMLNNPKIHPLLAFQSSGVFVDPEAAYKLSMEYYEEQMKKQEQAQNQEPAATNNNEE